MIEVSIAMVVLLVAIGGLSSTMLSTAQLARTNEEKALADDAARRMAADLGRQQFRQIFAAFNADPGDDPSGIGADPGANFAVPGLTPQRADPDGFVGSLEFPTLPLGGGPALQLREDVDNRALGMPRDLNGDGLDILDHASDYIVLPVTIRIQWLGVSGNSEIRMDLILVE